MDRMDICCGFTSLWGHVAGCHCEATPNEELLGVISPKSRSFKEILKALLEHVVVGVLAVSEGLSHGC